MSWKTRGKNGWIPNEFIEIAAKPGRSSPTIVMGLREGRFWSRVIERIVKPVLKCQMIKDYDYETMIMMTTIVDVIMF